VQEAPTAPTPAYTTALGDLYHGDALTVLPALARAGRRAKLIFTSPPFALLKKKAYGNEPADAYLAWFAPFVDLFKQILEPGGSLVIELGGAWLKGLPVRSTYQFELLLALCRSGFYLAQDFYHYNPARLPTPAEWVTIRRLRVKDAVNTIWWLVQDPFAPADNRRVLREYSGSMRELLRKGYRARKRPSGHEISTKFGRDNGGSIPPNLIEIANTESNSRYLTECRRHHLPPHPARFPRALPEFFIRFLTAPGDTVLDPFAGSNVTGEAAELAGRRWVGIELREEYVRGSRFRFD
jgi:DNA modification methylase